MDIEDCQARADACAANALAATDEALSQEFLKLAAQWRAMAVRTIVLDIDEQPEALPFKNDLMVTPVKRIKPGVSE